MYLITSIILVSLLVFFGKSFVKKQAVLCYLLATLLSVVLITCSFTGVVKHFPLWIRTGIWPILAKSTFSTTIFVVVMFMGAFPNGSKLQKKLMPIRGELSIIASILTLGHNISYGRTYFKLLFTKPEQLPLNQLLAAICSVIMLCIMLPLFVTSFKTVRRKMNGRSWKELQRFAYGFYGLIYIHVLLLMMPKAIEGAINYSINVILYSIIFLTYAAMRTNKALCKKAVVLRRTPIIVSSVILLIICCVSLFPLVNYPFKHAAPIDYETNSAQKADNDKVLESKASEVESTKVDAPEPVAAENSELEAKESEPIENISKEPEFCDAPEVQQYKTGTFSGSGVGYVDDITVKITIEDNKIVTIRPIAFSEDEPYWTDSKKVINLILSSQSTDVDAISGATTSSKGIVEAVRNALEKAKEDGNN